MKSTIKITAVVLAVCAAAFLTVSAITQRAEPDASEMYVLRDYNGRIAVFACGASGGIRYFHLLPAQKRSGARLQRNNG